MIRRLRGISFLLMSVWFIFTISSALLVRSPGKSLSSLWLYSISTESLGSALPKVTPAPPADVGLPDVYYVGLWTYCSLSGDQEISCPHRKIFPPLFFFDLPLVLLHDLLASASATPNTDIGNNIFFPSDIYPVPSPRVFMSFTIPQILAYATSFCYVIAFFASLSAAITLTFTLYPPKWPALSLLMGYSEFAPRPAPKSRVRALRRASSICACALSFGAITGILHVGIVLFKLNHEITLAYDVARVNFLALSELLCTAVFGLLSYISVRKYTSRAAGRELPSYKNNVYLDMTSPASQSGTMVNALFASLSSPRKVSPQSESVFGSKHAPLSYLQESQKVASILALPSLWGRTFDNLTAPSDTLSSMVMPD
ncbi:uncharacterized protein V1518DRAFT_12707 [Limtongia smithiae]|uniref:uncharacterized protein n=1 Tax=Limtongia smithiae TaxID=1125753 RepID=UPI0034CEF087